MFWAPPFPFVLGHESVGTVAEVGARVRRFKVGDRVTRPLAFWPGSRDGLAVAMGGFSELSVVRDGVAMAADGDESLVEDYNCLRQNVVPPHLSPTEAALAISLAETASVLHGLPSLRGRRIAVLGTGVAGLSLMLWCKLAGARVIAVGRRQSRLDEAVATFGADASACAEGPAEVSASIVEAVGGKVDGLLEATGSPKFARAALDALEQDGFAVTYGVPATGDSYDGRWVEASVNEHLAYPWIADLLRRKLVRAEWFVSHEWPREDLIHAFDEVRSGKVRKGFISF